jgi:DivIVA domain-containing protein
VPVPLSPEQIVAEEFRLRARGYDRDEVDAFLDRLADQVEADAARLRSVEQRASALEAELAAVREREATLTRTLATVQDAADRARADAEAEVATLRTATERELSQTRAEAQAEAADIRSAAEHEAAELRARLRQVQELDAAHRDRLRRHLQGQLDDLDALPDPYAELLERTPGPAPGPVTEPTAAAETPSADPLAAAAPPVEPATAHPEEAASVVALDGSEADTAPDDSVGSREPDEPGGTTEAVEEEPPADPWRRRAEHTDDGPPRERPVEPDPPIWG